MSDQMRHDAEKNRYELEQDGGIAYIDYLRQGDTLVITHTVTPPALRGRGLAGRLTKYVLDDARAQGLKVLPLCSFAEVYFERHPAERDLLAEP